MKKWKSCFFYYQLKSAQVCEIPVVLDLWKISLILEYNVILYFAVENIFRIISVLNDLGLSIGNPKILAHTRPDMTPRARETPKRTV